MKISFELNPPRIIQDQFFDLNLMNQEVEKFIKRALSIVDLTDGIHLTDSVFGFPQISSVTAANYIKARCGKTNLSCSVRSRDRNFISFCHSVSDAILIGVKSLLIVMGHDPAQASTHLGLKPSTLLNMLHNDQYDKSIDFYLTIPNKIKNVSLIQKKIDAKPNAFVTQPIESIEDLGEIIDIAHSHNILVVAYIMVPSKNNQTSVERIGLDWREYLHNPVDFVKESATIADEVLLSSPDSFKSGLELLQSLINQRNHT